MKIRIIEIECGADHNLAIDTNRNLYSWGFNYAGQCGNDSMVDVETPYLVKTDSACIAIDCGYNHSYYRTADDKHYLFGNSEYKQCIKQTQTGYVLSPYCINYDIEDQFDGKKIQNVILGNDSTFLFIA